MCDLFLVPYEDILGLMSHVTHRVRCLTCHVCMRLVIGKNLIWNVFDRSSEESKMFKINRYFSRICFNQSCKKSPTLSQRDLGNS